MKNNLFLAKFFKLKSSVKNLRLLPLIFICLITILVYLNFSDNKPGRQDKLFNPLKKEQILLLNYFDYFNAKLSDKPDKTRLNTPILIYKIPPNRKAQSVHCLINYKMKAEKVSNFIYFWYRDNKLFLADTIKQSKEDTTSMSSIFVPRSHAGLWSVDIMLNSGIILKTISFSIMLKSPLRRYRSLKSNQS